VLSGIALAVFESSSQELLLKRLLLLWSAMVEYCPLSGIDCFAELCFDFLNRLLEHVCSRVIKMRRIRFSPPEIARLLYLGLWSQVREPPDSEVNGNTSPALTVGAIFILKGVLRLSPRFASPLVCDATQNVPTPQGFPNRGRSAVARIT
jgi:hypothetical protein